ncbi:GNAT family N-acetyltransferase [Paenibacillus sp. GCM10027628]|uniref:GNAT family N-acetyltransferase n=1 Tax=Paenibacillus sp. GCM10027628 TaxID=3273413 RepID=UPI00363B0950
MNIQMITKEMAWEIRHIVMWPDRDLSFVQLNNDDEGYHYGLFTEDRLVSVISLFLDQDGAQFRKFATLEQEQGKGYGSFLLHHIMEEARSLGAKRIWCNARLSKAAFYKKFGLAETTDIFMKNEIPYVIMEKSFSETSKS